MGCNDSKNNTLEDDTFESKENKDSTITKGNKRYIPTNVSSSSFWGDTIGEFDVTIFSDLLKNDSLEKAAVYLKHNKPSETDTINFNIYKSNLSNILIRQGKFEKVIELLSEVISSETSSSKITERLLRSESYIQIGCIEDAISDLTFVIKKGGRYRWRAYRQRGIIKYEILKDSAGGCEDLKKSVVNDYSKRIYREYCD